MMDEHPDPSPGPDLGGAAAGAAPPPVPTEAGAVIATATAQPPPPATTAPPAAEAGAAAATAPPAAAPSPGSVVAGGVPVGCVVSTGLFACAVESCLCPLALDALAVGTYQLDETKAERERVGNVQLMRVGPPSPGEGTGGVPMLVPVHTLGMASGVLDCKWDPSGAPLLACGTALGALCLATLDTQAWNDPCEFQQGEQSVLAMRASSEPVGHLFLSIDWDNRATQASTDARIAVSEQAGCLSIWRVGEVGCELEHRWAAHDLWGEPSETWVARFNPHNPSLVLSGADDCVLKGWDLRMDCVSGAVEAAKESFQVKHQHDAGVTTVCWSPSCDYHFASGSYDGRVRFWDVRQTRKPIGDVDVGGGVWRLAWHPEETVLAAACMHNGVQIVQAKDLAAPSVAFGYAHHSSLVYGVDWCRCAMGSSSQPRTATPLLASCSFYDHSLHAWAVPPLLWPQ